MPLFPNPEFSTSSVPLTNDWDGPVELFLSSIGGVDRDSCRENESKTRIKHTLNFKLAI